MAATRYGLQNLACLPGTETQAGNETWKRVRSLMITASSCHKFLAREHQDLSKKVHDLLWAPPPELKNVGVWVEVWEVERSKRTSSLFIQNREPGGTNGLVGEPQISRLGASPDGIVKCAATGERGLLEIKCSYLLKNYSPTDLYRLTEDQRKRYYLQDLAGEVVFNKKHQYHAQIQMQLGITEYQWCDFVSRTPNEIFVERIFKSDAWWNEAPTTLVNLHAEYIILDYLEMRTPRKLPPHKLEV